MTVITAVGSPQQIGETIGRMVRPLVVQASRLVRPEEADDSSAATDLTRVEARLAESLPHILEEIDGVARGAKIAYSDALLLSVSSEVGGELPGWCSLLTGNANGAAILAKNLDAPAKLAPAQVIERLSPTDRLSFLHVTTAGATWSDGGINQAGVAVVNASVRPRRRDPSGLPDGLLAREILSSCSTVDEAIELADNFRFGAFGENMLIADRSGEATLLQKLPHEQTQVERPFNGAVCNRPHSPLLAELADPDDPVRLNSEQRQRYLSTLTDRTTASTVSSLKDLLADHEGGVCQHGSDGLTTIASIVLVPHKLEAHVADGSPCSSRFSRLTLNPNSGISLSAATTAAVATAGPGPCRLEPGS